MRLGEVEGVQGVEGGPHLVFHELRDLILAHELRVNGGDVPRAAVVARAGKFVGCEEGIDGRIAVAVHDERHVHVIDLLHHLVGEVLGKGRLALPVLFAARAAGQIGRGEECRPALRRAVQRDLHAADLEAVLVLAPFGHGELGEHLVHVGDEGIGDDIDDVRTGLAGALHRLELGKVRRTFVGRGDARLGVEHLTCPGPLDFLLRGHRLGLLEDREERRLHDEAPGFLGARLAHDHAARRGLGRRADAVFLQREAVHHRAVHRDVIDADRIVGESLVEVVAIEQPAVGHDGVVIAVAHDHLALGDVAFRGELLQLGDDARHVFARAGRRRVELALVGDEQRVDVVAVRVEEAGQQRLAAEVHDLRRVALHFQRVVLARRRRGSCRP